MFCPFCGKQNRDNALFCAYCEKALPNRSLPPPIQLIIKGNQSSKKASRPKAIMSNNAKKAVITVISIVALIIIVLLIFYPSIFPWNW